MEDAASEMRVEGEHSLQSVAHFLRAELLAAFEKMPLGEIARLAEAILQAGAVALLGVGKSGFVAEKMAASMSSLGLRSFAVNPLEALHGDLGRILPGDLALLISKSGETEELHRLVPSLHRRNVRTWAMTSNARSRLAQSCEEILLLPDCRELDPHNMMPTTSVTLQMMVGDLVLMALLGKRGFKVEEFYANHPAGRIGRRLALLVCDVQIALDQCPLAAPDTVLIDGIPILSAGRSGCVLLVEEGRLKGIFTDGDLRRVLERHGAAALQQPLGAFATPAPRTTTPQALAVEAMRLMEERSPVTVLPVLENSLVVGLVRLHDIIQAGI